MPIYEYTCRKCGHPFEVLVRGKEKPACPACGSRSLEKQLSTFAASVKQSMPSCAGATPMCQAGGTCNPNLCGLGR